MPGLNFNYTEFLRKQNEQYIKKYGGDKIEGEANPQPINGFGGFVPSYRGSIHDSKVVRSLVRCMVSPMKPTTATGFRSKSKQFFSGEETESRAPSTNSADVRQSAKTPEQTSKEKDVEAHEKTAQTTAPPPGSSRAKSAPAATGRINQLEKEIKTPILRSRMSARSEPANQRPYVSRISMMSAGSSSYIQALRQERPATSQTLQKPVPITEKPTSILKGKSKSSQEIRESNDRNETPRSIKSIPRQQTPSSKSKHPQGYPQTLYGASYWYDWGDVPMPSLNYRPESYARDRKLTRSNGVIFHKHEGMVPKYMGYVPQYKFRHGSTFNVLTVNAAGNNAAHLKFKT